MYISFGKVITIITYEMGRYTLASLLDDRTKLFSTKEALIGYEQGESVKRLNYEDLQQQSIKVAKGLKGLGFEKGDHLILWLPNINEWYIFEHACARIGVVVIPVNSFLKANELAYIMSQSDAKGIVYLKSFLNIPYQQILEELLPELVSEKVGTWSNARFPKMNTVISITEDSPAGAISYKSLLETGNHILDVAIEDALKEVDPEDVHLIMYTSGTTGNPKGCMLTHKNILDNAWQFSAALHLNEDDRYLIPVPYFHIGGLTLGLISTIIRGGTVVSMDRFEPEKTFKILETEKVTTVIGAPTIYIALLHHPSVKNYKYFLKKAFMAGAPCPVDVCKQVMSTFGTNLTTGLGQTETSPAISITQPDDPIDIRVGTVGKVINGVEIRVVNPVTNEDVLNGEAGELWVKGPNVMKGYYKMPEKTEEAFYHGWFRTGDMVTKNENGVISIAGRIKEMIIVGGENVYPSEVEDYIRQHPKVKNVALIGVPDPKYGEVGAAVVQLLDGETMTSEEIITYCTGKIAKFKIPKYVKFVEDYPLTPAGKIQKFRIADELIKELELQEQLEVKKK